MNAKHTNSRAAQRRGSTPHGVGSVFARAVGLGVGRFARAKALYRRSHSAFTNRTSMTQTRQILIVDDDTDLRQALGEQLALHPEFEVAEATDVAAARQAIAERAARHRHHGRRPARHGRARGGQALARGRLQAADHHADRPRFRRRHGDRPRRRAPTTTSSSRSASPCCWRASACRCASTRPARRPNSRSAATRSGRRPRHLVDAKGAKLRLTEKEAAILRFLHRAERQACRARRCCATSGATTPT